MLKIRFTIFIFFMSFFNFFSVNAQTSLKPTEIERYLASLSQIQALMTNYQEAQSTEKKETIIDNTPPPSDATSRTPITDNLQRMESHPTYSRFEEIIISIGFKNSKEWADNGDKIMLAYSAYQLKNSNAQNPADLEEIKSNLDEQLSAVKKNQFISNEQKQTLINKIENSMALISDPNYIENENILIIEPFIERLNSLLRITNDTY